MLLLGELPAIQKLKKINMDKSLYKLKLVERIKQSANINTVMGFSIVNAINKAKSDNEVLRFIKEQAIDNPDLMGTVIGIELTNEILNLK